MPKTLIPRANAAAEASPAAVCTPLAASMPVPMPAPMDEAMRAEILRETLPLIADELDLPPPRPGLRVVAAMSGGVDSAVTAAALAQLGYDVIGVTLQLYDHGAALDRPGACCAGTDIGDARDVAAMLGLPHYVLDYESRFAETVIDQFADSYLRGETPVPCVQCNREVKFKDLLAVARDLGAVAMATGHYVRRVRGPDGAQLHRARDSSRDQSYFLFATTRRELDFLRFPLGGLPKSRVRLLASAFGLRVSAKPDSQDICFVPKGDYADVVRRLRPAAAKPGDIVHADGRVLGRHEGIIGYTIGQRRGLNVAVGEPLFVLRIEADANRIIVGPRALLRRHDIMVRDVNWLGADRARPAAAGDADEDLPILVRVRSTRPPVAGLLRALTDDRAAISLLDGEEGVAPGQAAVFYDAAAPDRVLGGGFIARAE